MDSAIAGILDRYGGLRFVVAPADALACHVRCDEVLVVVPDVRVHEPVAWSDVPSIIARIELEVGRWVASMPNEPHAREAVVMYQLRQKEDPRSKRSLDLSRIVET